MDENLGVSVVFDEDEEEEEGDADELRDEDEDEDDGVDDEEIRRTVASPTPSRVASRVVSAISCIFLRFVAGPAPCRVLRFVYFFSVLFLVSSPVVSSISSPVVSPISCPFPVSLLAGQRRFGIDRESLTAAGRIVPGDD